MSKLEDAVELVNSYNRPYGKPLVGVVHCSICEKEFVMQKQNVGNPKGVVCPSECLNEARRRRQRGER